MPWLYLLLAGLFEMGFTTCLKLSQGLTKVGWTLAFLILSTVSLVLLNLAARTIPLGTAYAVWTGIGAVGTVVIGILWFRDPVTFWRLFFLMTIIGSVIGLKFVSPEE